MRSMRRFAVATVAAAAVIAPSAATAANPSAVGGAAPTSVVRGSSTLLTVAVTAGTDPASTGVLVTCNLSPIGGSFVQLFSDNGTDGDSVAGDLVFSYRALVPTGTAPGDYSLPCVVSDAQGRITLPSIAISVKDVGADNLAPSVSAGVSYSVDEGSSVTVTATGSDPNGDALSYAWDLNNDGIFETPGQSALFTGADGPVTSTIAVKATDTGELSATDRTTVAIANVPPTATLTAPATAEVGKAFDLSLTGASDRSAADLAAGFTYAFDCGQGYGDFGPSPTAKCSSNSVGTVSVGARIRDRDGDFSEYRSPVDVSVSADSLCGLTRQLALKQQIADALCVKLAHESIGAYANQLAGQSGTEPGKAFADSDAQLLLALADRLMHG